MLHSDQEIQRLKQRIAAIYAQREQLKQALEQGRLLPRAGLARLEATDQLLSGLDSRFKQLWDAAHAAGNVPHSASEWARRTVFEPIHLDCVTAIMLKILDAKCKMRAAEKAALAAVYDVVKDRPNQSMGAEIHAAIAAARQSMNAEQAKCIHAWRKQAEAQIPKPVMKGFKHLLRSSLPIHTHAEE